MAQNGRPGNRAYSPYAVDSLEDVSQPTGSYPNGAYSNLGLVRSQENIARDPSTFKGSYQNQAYENADISHQYEDPAHLMVPAASTGPRRKRNELYEPTDLKKKGQETEGDDFMEDIGGGDTWLSRFVLSLILIVSLTSLLLVVLIIVGKLKPSCSSCSVSEQAAAPTGAKLGGSDTTDGSGVFVSASSNSPPDISSLEKLINELRGNISSIKTYMNQLQQDIQSTKGDLSDTNRNINGTKDKVSQIESRANNSISKIQHISQQVDASVSAINVSFFQELDTVRTRFDSRLNNTAQNLLNADSSLRDLLQTVNNSLSAQVQSIGKLQGLRGPPGFNGSKGDTGEQGPPGPQGNQGPQGDKGDRGPKGDPGTNGNDGAVGKKGDTGPQGVKGDSGARGPQGPQGPQGSRGTQGAGNFSQCTYKMMEGTGVTPDDAAIADVTLTEPSGKRIIGVSCSTNGALEYILKVFDNPTLRYICECRGQSNFFVPAGSPASMKCRIHYWECPLTT